MSDSQVNDFNSLKISGNQILIYNSILKPYVFEVS